MIATRLPLAKVDFRRNKEGGNVKAGSYVSIVDLGTRMHGEPEMKDAVSQDLGSSVPPKVRLGVVYRDAPRYQNKSF